MVAPNDPNNWVLLVEDYQQAQVVGGSQAKPRYAPIPTISIPSVPSTPFVAAFFGSPKAPSYYRSAGWLTQKIGLGITSSYAPDAYSNTRQKIYLRQIQLVQLDLVSPVFQLQFFPHYWIEDLQYAMWEYTGETVETTERFVETILSSTLQVSQ